MFFRLRNNLQLIFRQPGSLFGCKIVDYSGSFKIIQVFFFVNEENSYFTVCVKLKSVSKQKEVNVLDVVNSVPKLLINGWARSESTFR